MPLVPDSTDYNPNARQYHVGNKRGKTHLGLADAVILLCGALRDPVREGAGGGEADEPANDEGEVGVADLGSVPIVGRPAKDLGFCQVPEEEKVCRTCDHQAGPEDDRVEEYAEGRYDVAHEELLPATVRFLVSCELFLTRSPFADVDCRSRPGALESGHIGLFIVSGCGLVCHGLFRWKAFFLFINSFW